VPGDERVRAVIERVFADGEVCARSDGSRHAVFPVAVSAAEGEALRELVRRERARSTIEIGLGYGIATLFVCEGLLGGEAGSGARHVAIDPHQRSRFADCALQLLADAGLLDVVEHRPEPSELALPRLLAAGERFDLAFVDGNHRFDGVFVDLFYLGRLVRPGSVIVLDDYQLPGVRRAAAFFVSNLGWTIEEVSPPDELHRWAVVRTARGPDMRHYDAFVDF
jgi:predicted O-methyltransferase YrrM